MCSLALVSCESLDPDSIRFELLYPGSTKATETSFETGDVAGLFGVLYEGDQQMPLQISGNWINNEKLTFNGSKWQAAHKITWCDDTPMDIYAYYPHTDLASIEEEAFSVALDQSTEKNGSELGGYEKSDLLWAKAEHVQKSSDSPAPVMLRFSHICSKVVIRLIKGEFYSGNFPEDAELFIHNTVPTGVLNVETGSVSRNMFAGAEVIKCHKIPAASPDELPSFEVILIPQRAASRRPFIELVAGKTSYLVDDTFNFKPGKCYVYNMTLSSSPDQVIINIGGTVGGWD